MSNVRRRWLMLSLPLVLAGAGRLHAADGIGTTIPEFTLRDHHGKEHSLKSLAGPKGTAVVFLGTECPLAKLYVPRLNELTKEFAAKGVALIGVNSNIQDSMTELGAYARVNAISFPLLKDPDNAVADAFAAKRTPEAFVINANNVVCYRGRIDDQYGIGFLRPAPTHKDLALAVDAVVAGKPVEKPVTEPTGCIIGRFPRVQPTGSVTYSKQVARIFQEKCVHCHRAGEIGPFPMTSYDEVVGWAGMIQEVVNENRMPPWFASEKHSEFRNDCRMTAEEKKAINEWVAHGCPQGDLSDLPPARVFQDGWNIPKPDLVVWNSEKAYQVPAEGVVDYINMVVDPGLKEDKWVTFAEVRPSNRAVVHHVIVFLRRPGRGGSPLDLELIGGYAPGMPPAGGYKHAAAFVPKGSKFMFQMHYTPNGSPQEDRTCLGLKFMDPKEVDVQVKAGMAANFLFRIPPETDDYKVVSKYKFNRDSTLYALTPHMHLRGKSFKYELRHPDGRLETLLDVPRWDFGWQLRYEFKVPKSVPKGAEMLCTAYFDNSEKNLSNPDPKQEVRFGEQTWQEMMIGWFTVGAPRDAKSPEKPVVGKQQASAAESGLQ